jgi:hypothetical protein
MSNSFTLQFGKVSVTITGDSARCIHDLDDTEIVAARIAALATIDSQVAIAAPGAERIARLALARQAVTGLYSRAEEAAAYRGFVLDRIRTKHYEVTAGDISLTADGMIEVKPYFSTSFAGIWLTFPHQIPVDDELRGALAERLAELRAKADADLRQAMTLSDEDMDRHHGHLDYSRRDHASPALLAEYEAVVSAARSRIKARVQAAQLAKEAAEQALAEERRKWIAKNDPKAIEMEDDGYSIGGRLVSLVRQQIAEQIKALGYTVLVRSEEPEIKERRSPTDAAYDAAEKILELELVRYSTVRWQESHSTEGCGGGFHREVVEVDVAVPWNLDRTMLTLYVVGGGFAGGESDEE